MSPHDPAHPKLVARWAVPLVAVLVGVAYLLIGIAHDRTVLGVVELVIMLVYAAFLVHLRRRDSEPAALLAGDTGDERRVQIQLRSSAATGQVLIVLVVVGLFWSLAADNNYVGVFTTLAAIGGATSIGTTLWHSRRG